MKKGFTLIELLVVVLIIGILSAVALPQYQVAVAKSRISSLIPVVKSMANALELYRLSNGAYPPDDSSTDFGFDIQVPPGCTQAGTTGGNHCPNNVMYDLLDYGVPNVVAANKQVKLGYAIWLEHSDHPGAVRCLAVKTDETANKVCKSMGGTLISGETFRYFSEIVGSPNIYAL